MKARQKPVEFNMRELFDYALYRSVFARIIHDKSVVPLVGRLRGKVLELGAGVHDYSLHAHNCTEYIRSDYSPSGDDGRITVDATAIDFPDGTFDAVVCMSALEHIENYKQVLSEVDRVLKPGGQFLLCVPWLFPYHGAPEDYHRFSASALLVNLENYDIEEFEAVGNYWLTQAMFLQRPIWSRSKEASNTRIYDPLLRILGMIFILSGRNCTEEDDNYALLYTFLGRKSG